MHASTYGLICLTKDNISAPWINFEAGALGKSIDKSRVSPFLFRIKRSEVEGPILQFQSTVFERDDVLKLLKSVNGACGSDGLEDARLEKSFDVWWPELEKQLNEIPAEESTEPQIEAINSASSDQTSRVLEEILELTRNNHKILRAPDALLPVDYLQHVLRRSSRLGEFEIEERDRLERIHPGAVRDLVETYRNVLKFIGLAQADLEHHPAHRELISLIREMDRPLRYISKELGLRLPREVLSEKEEF